MEKSEHKRAAEPFGGTVEADQGGGTVEADQGGGTVEADQGGAKPAEATDENIYKQFWTVVGWVLGVCVALGLVRFLFLPENDRYIVPVTAADWTGWGTWAGAFGAVGAVYFAALSIRHSIEAQKGTARELKEDREHDRQLRADDRAEDRQQRAEERQLIREDREALKKDADQIAFQKAKQLSFTYNWNKPSDLEYEEVQGRRDRYLNDQDHHEAWMRAEEEHDDVALQSAFVTITNRSTDLGFGNLCLRLLEEKLDVTGIKIARRKAPPIGNSLKGSPPEWDWEPDQVPALPAEMKQWAIGPIGPGQQLLVALSFGTDQTFMDWDSTGLWSWDEWHSPSDARWILVEYQDAAGRLWMRSTRSPENLPFRPLEDKKA